MNIEKKRKKEIKLIQTMIELYASHHQDIDAQELIEYSTKRIEKCPMMKSKTFCSQCKIHCYEKHMQDKIKKVMRYSGIRMLWTHPILVIRHALKI